jgi:hypothetical protein
MITILDIDARKEVKLDKSEHSPIVIVGMIDTLSRAHILDQMKTNVITFSDRVRIVRHAVKEWVLLNDAKGNPIKYETEEIYLPGVGKKIVLSEGCLNYLSEDALMKISNAAIDLNFETKDTEKN